MSPSASNPSDHNEASPRRRIGSLLYPGAMSLDVCGPLQVFASANDERAWRAQAPLYDICLLGTETQAVTTSSGIRILPDIPWWEVRPEELDTLLIPGGQGIDRLVEEKALIAWIVAAEKVVRRLGSVCSGMKLLAATGLLSGHSATTHWDRVDELARTYPDIKVDGDRLYTFNAADSDGAGHLFTSAGVTAGIDLALALVEADTNRNLALAVARRLVMFMRRPGGQAQFSAWLVPNAQSTRLASLLERVGNNLDREWNLEQLAECVATTPRTLSRLFVRELGMSPGRYIERLRVDSARQLLEEGQVSVATAARLTGIGHAESLRRLFHKHLSVSPRDYQQRFAGVSQA